MSNIFVRSLQPATSVAIACTGSFSSPETQLVVSNGNSLQLWQLASGEASLVAETSTRQHIDHIAALTSPVSLASYLLVLSSPGDYCTLLSWQGAAFTTVARASLDVPDPVQSVGLRRFAGIKLSQPYSVAHSGSHTTLLAAAAYTGFLHLIRVSWSPNTGPTLELTCEPSTSEEASGLSTDVNHLTDLQFVPQPHPSGSAAGVHLLATLYVEHKKWGPLAHVRCIAVDRLQCTAWTIRNLDRSTSLLVPLDKAAGRSRCAIAAIGAHQATVFSTDGSVLHKINMGFTGVPACTARLDDGSIAIADSMGALCLLRVLDEGAAVQHITVEGPQTLPSVMCHLAGWTLSAEAGAQGMLYIGSHGGNSQLVSIPQDDSKHAATAATSQRSWSVTEPRFEDSLAPIHDAIVVEDPPGSGEGRLLMCCGLAPCGTLKLAKQAIGLQPSVTDGPVIQGRPQMSAVAADPDSEFDAYIMFSFEAGASTSLLRVTGTHFQPAHLQGLAYETTTLLLAALPGGRLAQVTPQEVRIVTEAEPGQLLTIWQPERGPISSAAQHGSCLAIAGGATVNLLDTSAADSMDAGSGGPAAGQHLWCVQQLQYAEQISAMAWVDAPDQEPWLAVGQWFTNEVLLHPLPDPPPSATSAARSGVTPSAPISAEHAVTVRLPSSQPRSIVAGMLHGHHFLFVGSSSGEVVYWQLAWSALETAMEAVSQPLSSSHHCQPTTQTTGASSISSSSAESGGVGGTCQQQGLSMGASRRVVAGLSEVELFWVPARAGAPAHVYALSDQSLVLRAADQLPETGVALDRVEVMRVHGAEHLTSLTPVHTPELQASLAWLSPAGTLMFGALAHDLKLRWHSTDVGATPTHLAYHAASSCAVVLLEPSPGQAGLRVVHVPSLKQLAGVQLAPGHQPLAIRTAMLASSSARQAASRKSGPPPVPNTAKEFVIVSSYLSSGQAAAAADPASNPGNQPDNHAARAASGQDVSTSGQTDGLDHLTGVLSIFEIVATAQQDGRRQRYTLVLHGTCTLPALCHCLAVCPDMSPQHSNAQVLLLGCHDGLVRMYRAAVDDAAQAGPHSLATALVNISQPSAWPQLSPQLAADHGHAIAQPEASAAANGAAQLARQKADAPVTDQQQDWRHRVALDLLGQAETWAAANITSLSVHGRAVVACDFLGSVTIMRVCPEQPAPLLAVSADKTPMYAQAGLAVSETLTLVAPHPYGLVLLQRDPHAEARAEEDKLRAAQAKFEAGRAAAGPAGEAPAPAEAQGGGDSAAAEAEAEAHKAWEAFIQPLEPVAACDRGQMITCFCHGRLGVQPMDCQPEDEGSGASHEARRGVDAVPGWLLGQAGTSLGADPMLSGLTGRLEPLLLGDALGMGRSPVLYVTATGGVGSVQLLSSAEMEALQVMQLNVLLAPGANALQDRLGLLSNGDNPVQSMMNPASMTSPWVPPYLRPLGPDADDPGNEDEAQSQLRRMLGTLAESVIDADLSDRLLTERRMRLPQWLSSDGKFGGQLQYG